MAAAAVLPLLAYGAWSIVSSRDGATTTVIQGNKNVASRAAEQIEQYVVSCIRILKALAADLNQTGLDQWQKDRILKNYALEFPELTELTILNASGEPVATSRVGQATVSLPGSGSREINGVLFSSFTLDDDLLPTAILASPLTDRTNDRWLVARVNLEELWRMVDDIKVGRQGHAMVITQEGILLAHGDPESKPLVARGADMLVHPLIADIRAQRDAEETPSLEYPDWIGEGRDRGRIVGVAAPVSSLAWTVVVEQPTSDAYAVPDALQRQLVIAIVLSLMAMMIVGYFWGRSFINPILSLTRGTKALAEGRLDERVAVASRDELGQLGAAFNNMADRLVELQENVKKQERQAMFGRVAVGLVHDLSNPIQNIGNACKMIVMMFDDLEYRESFKRTVERELVQVKRMLDDLRNVAKPVPLQKFPLDVNKALAELAESMQTTAESAGLTLHTELATGPLYIEGDLYALNRVYRNLLTNAFQATMARGRVTIRTIGQDEHAVIEIADTGSGIPPERLATIFDDFVTTKRRGLGLGLAISKKIVEQLGGTIAVASDVGRGTTFTIRFPLTRERPQQLAAS
jgi:signal transduction histidine kinase